MNMNKKGFSMIEMLTVVLIISILSAIALPQYSRVREKAHFARAQVMAKSLYNSCERLLIEFGSDYSRAFTAPYDSKPISRLDISDEASLPAGFVANDTTITGAGFSFGIAANSDGDGCVVNIAKTSGETVSIKFDGEKFLCQTGSNAEMCSLYKVEFASGD